MNIPWSKIAIGSLIIAKLPNKKFVSWFVIRKHSENITFIQTSYKNLGLEYREIVVRKDSIPSIMMISECELCTIA